MTITVSIGGVDRTAYLQEHSLSINSQLNSRDTASFQLVDETTRTAGITVFEDHFTEAATDWTNYAGSGELSVVDNVDGTDGKVLRVGDNSGNDQAWLIHDTNIVFDETKLYRTTVRLRNHTGTNTVIAGIAGVASDGTTLNNATGVNSHSGQHYHCESGATPGTTFTTYTGYTKGFGMPNGTGSEAVDPDNPGVVHSDVVYIRPLLLVNYSAAAGIAEVDYFKIEEVPLAEVGNEVIIQRDSTTIFGGYVRAVDEQQINNSKAFYYGVQCDDYSSLCDHRLVSKVYENQTAGAIIADILSDHLASDGFTGAAVATGPTITKAVYNYTRVSDAFNELSEITGYSWYIDDLKDIHFFSRETNTAPFSVTSAQYNVQDIRINYTQENYRNRQYIRAGFDITADQTELFAGDGKRRVFTLAFPVAEVPSAITADTVSKTIGIQGVDTGKQYYWNKNSKEIVQDEGEAVLISSNELSVTYKGFFPLILKADDNDEITSRAATEGNTGIYESVFDDQNIDKLDIAIDKADGLLRRFATIPKRVTFTTRTAGLIQGQLITFDVTEHNLSEDLLIESVAFADDPAGGVYTVTALSGEAFGGWVHFFKQLVNQGRTFVVRENEVLTLLKRFKEQIEFSDSLTVSSSAFSCAEIGTAEIGYSEICP